MSKSNNRKLDLSIYGHLYRFVNPVRNKSNLYWDCVYCGMPASERDHVPPITRVVDYRQLGLINEIYILVPSCGSCNKLLGNSLQSSIFERIEYLKDILLKRNKKTLTSEEWDNSEIEELGKNLKSLIVSSNKKKKDILYRYEYYGGYEALCDMDLTPCSLGGNK